MLVAADKFKGSLTAVQVAERVTAGLRRVVPDLEVTAMPVADGGDGTVDAAVAAGFERRETRVAGPLGDEVTAAFAVRGDTAVVEMAEASGLQRLPKGIFAPLTSSTYGSGELLRAALDAGARTIVFGVGGSATTDGGAGMLSALGARFLDAEGEPVPPGGGGLADLASADLTGLDPRLTSVDLILASDVDNPLTGPKGAPAVYGPQKGAAPDDVDALDAALGHYVKVLEEAIGGKAAEYAAAPGAGAAGGIGYGALLLGARFRPGIEVMLDVLGFASALEGATLVITGEGSWTSRPSTARPRQAWPRRPAPRARRSSPSAAASPPAPVPRSRGHPPRVSPHVPRAGRGAVHRRRRADPGAGGGEHRAGLPGLSPARATSKGPEP